MFMRRVAYSAAVLLLAAPIDARAQLTALGSEFQINSYTTESQVYPSIDRDVSGNYVVVWMSVGQDAGAGGVYGQRLDPAGLPLGTEFQVNTYTTGSQSQPEVAVAADGSFAVVWQDFSFNDRDGSGAAIIFRRYDGTGTPTTAEVVANVYTTGEQIRPDIAAAPGGGYLVVWESGSISSPDGSGATVSGRRFNAAGSPAGTEFVVNSYTTGSQGFPAVAAGASGFAVTWTSLQDGDGNGVFAQVFDTTATSVGTEFQVNTYTTDDQELSSVAIEAGGDFVIAWGSQGGQDGESDGVFGQRYDSAANPIGTEFQVNTFTTSSQFVGFPSVKHVGMDSSGNATVTWLSVDQDGTPASVYAQRFDTSSNPLGTEFAVATYTLGIESDSVVSRADAAGTFLIAWEGDHDGDKQGVFGRCFGTTCGNGAIDDCEQCDDGNTTSGDGCDSACTVEPCFTCSGAPSSCVDAPALTCTAAPTSILTIKDDAVNDKDKMTWKWINGTIDPPELGNPVNGATDYTLCVYDESGAVASAVMEAALPAGGECDGDPCWRATGGTPPSGQRYKDLEATPSGVRTLILKGGIAGKARIILKGKGSALPLPGPVGAEYFDVDPEVTVQLSNNAGSCWGAAYDAADIKKNEADHFKAKD